MRGNGKVFISHAHEDNERCAPLLAALDAWTVDYWFDTRRMQAGDDLSQTIQRAIAGRDVFLRICTPAAQRSYWVKLETGAFRGLQAKQHRAGEDTSRVMINLILDAGYEPEPFDYAHIFIDAANKPQRVWLEELRQALEIMAPAAVADPAEPAEPATAPSSAEPVPLIVDHTGRGGYLTIGAAIRAASNGDRIHIQPGTYHEEIVLDKALTLAGQGDPGAVIIEATRASALRFEAPSGQIRRLTLRQFGGKNLDCVAVTQGRLELIRCDISTQTAGACVNISSDDETLLQHNRIHDGGGWGVFLAGTGIVTLEDNEISAHAYSGLTVTTSAYAVARRNHFVKNAQYGVRIYANAGGIFEENDLRGNYLEGWSIDPASFGKVLRERNKG